MTLTCEPRIADAWASPLESLPQGTVVAVRTGASLRRVAKLMHTTGASSVLVRSTRPAIVTERDLVRAVAEGKSQGTLVDDLASQDLVTAAPSITLRQALHLMLDHQIRHLVVVDADQTATGVISMREIVSGAADQTRPTGYLPGAPEEADIPRLVSSTPSPGDLPGPPTHAPVSQASRGEGVSTCLLSL